MLKQEAELKKIKEEELKRIKEIQEGELKILTLSLSLMMNWCKRDSILEE